jgi:hypothetical protein
MTKQEMIEEIVERELQSVPVLELIQMFLHISRTMLDEQNSEQDIRDMYESAFGSDNEEVVH